MQLIILGCGIYVPELNRNHSSYLLQIGKQNLVFDFGKGALNGLLKAGVHYYDIDFVFLSHQHADHISELTSLLHICLCEIPGLKKRKKELIIYGPKGIKKAIDNLLKAVKIDSSLHSAIPMVIVKELGSGDIVKGKGWKVKASSVFHTPTMKSLCFRVEAEKKVFCYSGDSGDCKGLREACNEADLALLEACLSPDMSFKGHLKGGDAGRIASEEKAKKLVLTHIYGEFVKAAISDAKRQFKGTIILAKDGMKIRI